MVAQAVKLYNSRRLHRSLKMQTPNQAHALQNHQYATYRKEKSAA
jgi:transposase InsO family protein